MKITVIVLALIIVILLGVLFFVPAAKSPAGGTNPGNSSSSVAAAISPDGNVRVDAPGAGSVVTSPVSVGGTVTGGGWFFEAIFPVKVLDGDGTVLGTGVAQAQGDWMSTGIVPFVANITFAQPKFATGTIVFSKDNPSGLPANAESLNIPVRFQ